jgi:hypothetical protein
MQYFEIEGEMCVHRSLKKGDWGDLNLTGKAR